MEETLRWPVLFMPKGWCRGAILAMGKACWVVCCCSDEGDAGYSSLEAVLDPLGHLA